MRAASASMRSLGPVLVLTPRRLTVRSGRQRYRPGMAWETLSYSAWRETCDTLHAHTQVLGKIAVTLAPPEPQLQHAALRLTARGWESVALPAGGGGALVVGLDLHAHVAFAEHSDGRVVRVPLGPDRAVGDVTRDLLEGVHGLGVAV